MKKLLSTLTSLLLISSIGLATVPAQNANTSASSASAKTPKKRGPVFRASKEQIKHAQSIVKESGFYSGYQTGKLDADTRASLKKYQEAENIKATGTLNKVTLEKMGIALTDKQKTM